MTHSQQGRYGKANPGAPRKAIPPDTVKEIVRRYRDGEGITGIAKWAGGSEYLTRRILLEAGVPLRSAAVRGELTPIFDPDACGKSRADLSGQRFGGLTAIREAGRDPNGKLYWEVVCDCGQIKAMQTSTLQSLPKGCGCKSKRSDGQAARHNRFLIYRNGAAKRGISWRLSETEFVTLCGSCCHYCGCHPAGEHRVTDHAGIFIYNGIDRKSNDGPYDSENCVPCCAACNYAKRGQGYPEFVAWLERIALFRTTSP